jgi:hypothetical protein
VKQPQAQADLAALREAGWVDRQTRQVTLRLLLLNANQNPDAPYYESMTISHIFETGGYITSQVLVQAVPKEPYPGGVSIALDVVWLCSLLTIVMTEVNEVRESINKNELKAYLSEFWNVFDWLVGLTGLAICAIWGYTIRAIFLVDDYVIGEDTDDVIFGLGDWLRLGLDALQILHANFVILASLRLFKALIEQPQLAMVPKTLQIAWKDLLHFAIVGVVIFVCYSNAGVFLFASAHDDFQKFDYAAISCLNMLFGAFDWQMLGTRHRTVAFTYFMTFMVLVYLVMVNMLLVIVIEASMEVQGDKGPQDSLFKVGRNLLRSLRAAEGHWRVSRQRACVDSFEGDYLMPNQLVACGMPKEQVVNLAHHCREMTQTEQTQKTNLRSALSMVAWVHQSTSRISNALNNQGTGGWRRVRQGLLRHRRNGTLFRLMPPRTVLKSNAETRIQSLVHGLWAEVNAEGQIWEEQAAKDRPVDDLVDLRETIREGCSGSVEVLKTRLLQEVEWLDAVMATASTRASEETEELLRLSQELEWELSCAITEKRKQMEPPQRQRRIRG